MGSVLTDTKDEIKHETCDNNPCPVRNCSGWEVSSECSVTCGEGIETIKQTCQSVHADGKCDDAEEEEEVRACVRDACPGIVYTFIM